MHKFYLTVSCSLTSSSLNFCMGPLYYCKTYQFWSYFKFVNKELLLFMYIEIAEGVKAPYLMHFEEFVLFMGILYINVKQ